ncbi:MAG: TlpA family protein disulfide reductase [Bacteroidetes bacterium]|nr:TlpA family protein disulfide reductase [Bacteroidota bacterium]
MKLCLAFLLIFSVFQYDTAAQPNNLFTNPIHIIKKCSGDDRFFFSYIDPFGDLQNSLALFKSINQDITNFDIPSTLVTFSFDQELYPVYIKAGDSILVYCKNDTPKYEFKGGNIGELNFLPRFEKKFGFVVPQMAGIKITNRINYDYYAAENKRIYNSSIEFLKKNSDSLHFSKSFTQSLSSMIRYRYLVPLLAPFYTKEGKDFSRKKIPPSYIEMLKNLKPLIYISDSTNSTRNEAMLKLYNVFLSRDSITGDPLHDFHVLYKEGKKNFEGVQKDIVLFRVMKDHAAKGITGFDQYLEDFGKECSNPYYVKYIDSVYKRFKPQYLSEELLKTILKNQAGEAVVLEDILKADEGKVVYVDFWASWCGPCLNEMPNSKLVEEKLKNDPVKFVYISVDSKKEAWTKSIDKNKLTCEKCEHYLLDDKSPLAKYFQVPPIPKYLLLNKKGMVATPDAPRPSDPNLMNFIATLVN